MTSLFYGLFDLLIIGYIVYSWYWQAVVDYPGRYRISSIIWAVVFVYVSISWNFIDITQAGAPVLLAVFLVMSVMDGVSGLGEKRIVISGYIRRTIKYSDLDQITLINAPLTNNKSYVVMELQSKGHVYYIRFAKGMEDVIATLKKHLGNDVGIKIEIL